MREVGVRELKERTSEIIRLVREKKEAVVITFRGKVVARIYPEEDLEKMKAHDLQILKEMDELAKEIGAHWPPGVSAAEAVKEQRREL